LISGNDGRYRLDGPVGLANVALLVAEGERRFSEPEIVVDLAGISTADSAAVSLLLEWTRRVQRANRRIAFANLPSNLATLAELYGVRGLLPLAAA
jgi:phospholipid transport system transporter-binding protein